MSMGSNMKFSPIPMNIDWSITKSNTILFLIDSHQTRSSHFPSIKNFNPFGNCITIKDNSPDLYFLFVEDAFGDGFFFNNIIHQGFQ